jgi:hypothetical protein
MGLGQVDREEIWQWAEAVCEGTIPPDDLFRLEARLQQSQEARVLFLHYLHLHGELYWHLNLLGVKQIAGLAEGQKAEPTLLHKAPQKVAEAWGSKLLLPSSTGQKTSLQEWPSRRTRRWAETLLSTWKDWFTPSYFVSTVLVAILLAMVAIVALPKLWDWWGGAGGPFRRPEALPVVAQVVEVWDLAGTQTLEDPVGEWSGKDTTTPQPLRRGSEIRVGWAALKLALEEGGEAIFEGPGRLVFKGNNQLALTKGALAVMLPPGLRKGYEIKTPFGTVRDLGTSFAVRVGQTEGEVHVFEGQVEVTSSELSEDGNGRPRIDQGQRESSEIWSNTRRDSRSSSHIRLGRNQALRLLRQGEGWVWEIMEAQPGRFLRSEDAPPCVPRWRMKVQSDPRLAHLWSFEGWTVAEKLRDWRDNLHLHEVVMFGGAGGGKVGYFAAGAGPTSRAVWPFRIPRGGNSQGVGFQTTAPLQLWDALTLECILAFQRPEEPSPGDICVILGIREAPDRPSILLGTDGFGQLLISLDPDQDWLEVPFRLMSNEWYYLAVSFRKSESQSTTGAIVDLWAANLNQPGAKLIRLLTDQPIAGWPPAGWLGVGKGFETGGAHAYPWAGPIDEVALYQEALKDEEIAEHFQILMGGTAPFADRKVGSRSQSSEVRDIEAEPTSRPPEPWGQ